MHSCELKFELTSDLSPIETSGYLHLLSLTFFEKLAIEKCLCCHCCYFAGVMVAPGERGYTVSKFHRIIDENINLDEPMSYIDVPVNSVTNAGEKLGT